MGRAVRIGAVLLVTVGLVLIGIQAGMFIRLNDSWVALHWPVPQASAGLAASVVYESPAWVLALGWVVAAVLAAATLTWVPIYLRRRRQTSAELARLEREVTELRNLPIKTPAPFADLPAEDRARAERELDPVVGAEE